MELRIQFLYNVSNLDIRPGVTVYTIRATITCILQVETGSILCSLPGIFAISRGPVSPILVSSRLRSNDLGTRKPRSVGDGKASPATRGCKVAVAEPSIAAQCRHSEHVRPSVGPRLMPPTGGVFEPCRIHWGSSVS
jgi:hypothetical protein